MSGALLFNVQTQRPEWVDASRIGAALASGNYRDTGGVTEEVAPGLGATTPATEAAPRLVAGSQTVTAASQAASQARARQDAQYDTLWQEVLTGLEGGASGLTFGLTRAFQGEDADRRQEVNPNAALTGELAGAVAPFLVSGGAGGLAGAALRATPAGLAARAGLGAGKVVAGAGRVASLAVEGAVAGAISGTGHAAARALQGDPAELADGILLEAGIGGLMGGAAGVIGKGARAIQDKVSARAIKAANPLLDHASPAAAGLRGEIKGALDELAGAQKQAAARIKMLQDMAPDLNNTPAWLADKIAERAQMAAAASRAERDVMRAFGVKTGGALDDAAILKVLSRSRPKDVLKAAKALDDYSRAVSELDAAVRPAVSPAAERAAREMDLAKTSEFLPPSMDDITQTRVRPAPQLPGPPRAGDVGTLPPATPGPAPVGNTIPYRPNNNTVQLPGRTPTVVGDLPPVDMPPEMAATMRLNNMPRGPLAAPGAVKPVHQPTIAAMTGKPVQVSPFAEKITGHLEALQNQTGLQLNAMDALAVADAVGLDLDALPAVGPVADGLVKLWLLGRVASLAASRGGQKAMAKRGIIERAIEGGAGSVAAKGGRAVAGPFGAGAAYVFGARAVRGAAGAASSAGRAAEKVAASTAAFLGRASRAAVPTVGPVSWGGGRPGDFEARAAEIRQANGSPDAVAARVVATLGPDLPPEMVERAVARTQEITANLARRLPSQRQDYPLVAPAAPDPEELRAFQEYDWAAANPAEAIMRAVRGGLTVPMAESLQENHPSLLAKVLTDVLSQPETLRELPTARLVSLSNLVGYPLVPEADPAYTQFHQQSYAAAREALDKQQQSNQSSAAIRSGTTPTAGQAYSAGPTVR